MSKKYHPTITSLQTALQGAAYDGGALVTTALDYFQAVHAHDLEIVDPSNPAVLIIEMMGVSTANAVRHSDNNLANRYVSLATNFAELYPHMSDEDHDDIFALSGSLQFTVLIPVENLLKRSIPDATNTYRYVSIPRDTEVRVGDMTYTFKDLIEIRSFVSDAIKVVRVQEEGEGIPSYTIDSEGFKGDNGDRWLRFTVELDQVTKRSQDFNVLRSTNFDATMDFTGQFKSVKVYSQHPDGTLTPILTKFIEDQYDPLTITAVVRVTERQVHVFIPKIYTLIHKILIIVESTQGEVEVDYFRYGDSAFTYTLRDLKKDLTPSDKAFNALVANIISEDKLEGGRDALTFIELRERIINNTIGSNKIPITQRQVLGNISLINFDSYRTVDSLTGRTYVVSSDIPLIANKSFTTEVDVTFINMATTIKALRLEDTVLAHQDTITILPTTMYEVDGLSVSIVPIDEVNAWKVKDNREILDVEQKNWRISPFFYVIDHSENRIETHVYQLDNPSVLIKDHVSNNYSTDLFMSSKLVNVEYMEESHDYKLTVTLKQDAKLTLEDEGDVWGQLVLMNDGNLLHLDMYSINKSSDGVFVLEWILETDLNVNGEVIVFNNFQDTQGTITPIALNLLSDIHAIYGTISIPTNYATSQINELVYQDTTLAHKYPLTHERFSIKFGLSLEYLWRDSRLITTVEYEKWTHDVPDTYAKTVIPYDPSQGDDVVPFTLDANCELVFNAAHVKGDIKYDNDGNMLYVHRRGDFKRDSNNALIRLATDKRKITLDILTFNGITTFINNQEILSVFSQVEEFIIRQSTRDITPLLDNTLEHTKLLYKPKSSLGLVRVSTGDGEVIWIDKEQKLSITILVSQNVYSNEEIRVRIIDGVTVTLSQTIQNLTVSYSDLTNAIKTNLGELIVSVAIDGFGGVDDKELVVTVEDAGDKLSIAKRHVLDDELNVTQTEDIKVHFKQHIQHDHHTDLR